MINEKKRNGFFKFSVIYVLIYRMWIYKSYDRNNDGNIVGECALCIPEKISPANIIHNE